MIASAAAVIGHGLNWLVAAGVLTVAGGLYALSCWWFPFRNCGRCEGAGRFRSRSGKVFRLCRRCKGSGRQLRLGRWLWNHAVKMRRDAD